MNNLIKPRALRKGDTVALITLSWGGAAEFPERYESGKKQIEETFGLKVIETPNALKSADWIAQNPQKRLDDLMWAFSNDEVKGIFTIIGGSDSVKLLELITEEHLSTIRKNPKVFVGFSDTTTINLLCLRAGLVSFYGPTVLFGFAENCGIHKYTSMYFEKAAFTAKPIGEITNCTDGWILDRVPWNKEFQSIKRRFQEPVEMKYLQGAGSVEGKLIGGCMEVLEMIKRTNIWPEKNRWENAILFLETSEERPTPEKVKMWLRDYGRRGILNVLKGIIFGIPGGDIPFDDPNYKDKLHKHLAAFEEYDNALIEVAKEFNCSDLPIVSRVQFGHIMPTITIPLGISLKIDVDEKEIAIIEVSVTK